MRKKVSTAAPVGDVVEIRWLVGDRFIPRVGEAEKDKVRALPREIANELIAAGLAVEATEET